MIPFQKYSIIRPSEEDHLPSSIDPNNNINSNKRHTMSMMKMQNKPPLIIDVDLANKP